MRFFDSEEWHLSPAGGMTGSAYLAESGENRLFIKRNTSPFLAVLSAEGIVPRLLWTRRMSNGDVLSAQTWTKGRVLRPEEMKSGQVIELLRTIHRSEPLLLMMRRLGKRSVTTQLIFQQLAMKAEKGLLLPAVAEAIDFLRDKIRSAETDFKCVCHSDVNHNNWLLDTGKHNLYLIDWDQAVIADPAMDLSMLLYWYIDKKDWEKWLVRYGLKMTDSLRIRLIWHMIAMTLRFMFWYQDHGNVKKTILFKKDLIWLNRYAACVL